MEERFELTEAQLKRIVDVCDGEWGDPANFEIILDNLRNGRQFDLNIEYRY